MTSYEKAIELKKAATNDKDPNAASNLAAYYNNLAEAYAKANKTDDAVKTYELAAQADPAGAAQYYFNTGAVLTNAGKVDDALAAFDKVIAADPTRADAYYWKGVNMIGKATLQGDKMVAPPGTAEAFQKYLELQPSGTYADAAKQMLATIGEFGRNRLRHKKKAAEEVRSIFLIQRIRRPGRLIGRPFAFSRLLLRAMNLLSFASCLRRGTVNATAVFRSILWSCDSRN